MFLRRRAHRGRGDRGGAKALPSLLPTENPARQRRPLQQRHRVSSPTASHASLLLPRNLRTTKRVESPDALPESGKRRSSMPATRSRAHQQPVVWSTAGLIALVGVLLAALIAQPWA